MHLGKLIEERRVAEPSVTCLAPKNAHFTQQLRPVYRFSLGFPLSPRPLLSQERGQTSFSSGANQDLEPNVPKPPGFSDRLWF